MTTPFQERVYAAVRQVPHGKVTTYKLVGSHIGCRCCQAVGQALRRNPYAPDVPCHRVIASDRSLGGFAGQRAGSEVARKRHMLETEGIAFDTDGRVAATVTFHDWEEHGR